MTDANSAPSSNFITEIIDRDMAEGRYERVHTRFPPEPNGYLHIGHAMSVNLNYGIAQRYGGKFNLRFDDTNPTKEEQEYIDAIIRDVRWLGADWEDRLFYASDYFGQLYDWAVELIKQGKAYVDDLSPEEIREYRGSFTEPGRNSPYRDRSVEENLDLFERMRAGEFAEGERVLRAKIDMASPNMNLRDPILYRIMHAEHPRTGDDWCIYPMYDWAHGQSDSIERISHSLCTLEFEHHRPLYNWFIEQLGIYHPRQVEFGPLLPTYTIVSKRRLIRLVQEGYVSGWDDPRMPTISGMRRRGYSPQAIRTFVEMAGVSKNTGLVEFEMLEHAIRDDLNEHAPRAMAVLDPLKIVIENYPEEQVEYFDLPTYPQDKESTATRQAPFSREIYIERDDFMEDPPRRFFRLSPGQEVRLLGAYYITCTGVVKDEQSGEIVELRCSYDPASRGGATPDGRKVKGTLHWVSARHAHPAEVRLYDRLFKVENPYDFPEGGDFTDNINSDSLQIIENAQVEPSLAEAQPGDRFQFMRQGYFNVDPVLSTPGQLVFNRIVSLRDTWARIAGS